MPKKTTYRVYWTIKAYEDVEAKSVDEALQIHSASDCESTNFIEDSGEIYRVTRPNKDGYDIGKPNLLDK